MKENTQPEDEQSEDDEKGELTGDERSTAREKSGDDNESEDEAQQGEASKESEEEEEKEVNLSRGKDKAKGRPSAAACGFSTVGLTDQEVQERLATTKDKEKGCSSNGIRLKFQLRFKYYQLWESLRQLQAAVRSKTKQVQRPGHGRLDQSYQKVTFADG